jgi:hypothetical protein
VCSRCGLQAGKFACPAEPLAPVGGTLLRQQHIKKSIGLVAFAVAETNERVGVGNTKIVA